MAAITAVTMPKWGIEMTEGTITGWHLAVGAPVAKGAPLLDVETEKIVNVVDSPGSGVLRRILADPGATLPVGALVGIIAAATASETDIESFRQNFRAVALSFEPGVTASKQATAPLDAARATADGDGDGQVSPIARRIAERLGVDLSQVRGTGRNGRISKDDVEAYAAQPTAQNLPQRVPMSSRRLTIARKLLEAKQQIPHYRLEVDVDATALLARRAALAGLGQRVSVNDLLVRATALALLRHPLVNSQLVGAEILQYPHADIAIAMATEAGLITPVVRDADRKTLGQIAAEISALAKGARDGTLTREQITGATFTVSNLGMYGVARFDAIINPPQVAILAVGAAGERVVSRGGGFAAVDFLTLTMSADHRVVDGASGAAFLATLRELLGAAERL